EYTGPILPGPGLSAVTRLSPPVSVNRHIGLARIDRLFSGGAQRLMGRYASSSTDRPDFRWTPFTAFISGIEEATRGLALSLATTVRPSMLNELRFGYTEDDLFLGRAHPEIPLLTVLDGTTVPGSIVFSRFTNNVTTWQAVDNVTLTHGRR